MRLIGRLVIQRLTPSGIFEKTDRKSALARNDNELVASLTEQSINGLSVVDEVGAAAEIVPDGFLWNAESLINRCREVFGCVWVGDGVTPKFVRFTDDGAALNTTARKEGGLHGAPVIAPRQWGFRDLEDSGSAPKLTGHDDQGVL